MGAYKVINKRQRPGKHPPPFSKKSCPKCPWALWWRTMVWIMGNGRNLYLLSEWDKHFLYGTYNVWRQEPRLWTHHIPISITYGEPWGPYLVQCMMSGVYEYRPSIRGESPDEVSGDCRSDCSTKFVVCPTGRSTSPHTSGGVRRWGGQHYRAQLSTLSSQLSHIWCDIRAKNKRIFFFFCIIFCA